MSNQHSRPIYMDHHATTPVAPEVLTAMLPYFSERFGNASSIDHQYGTDASEAVEHARRQVAETINARADEIVFTSGATEADNLSILGLAQARASDGKHIITSAIEHSAVLDTCKFLQDAGWDVTYVPVGADGVVDPDEICKSIRSDTVLISIMMANNEIGTIQPISEIGEVARERRIAFHTDATQAIGHIPVDVQRANIDLLSLSAHKVYGPKGVGALFVRRHPARTKLLAQAHGGGHERRLRPGTLNVPGAVGLGAALELARKTMPIEMVRQHALRERLLSQLRIAIPDLEVNGHAERRLPHNLSVYIPGIEGRSLIVQLEDIVAFSTGSACTTASVEPSHVILALGYGEQRAYGTLRFGLGRSNTDNDINVVVPAMVKAVRRLRALRH